MTPFVSDFSDIDLPDLPDVPGMTSTAECRYLYWLASSQLTGAGRLVEIGTWLGRSTLHLAAGLDQSPHAEELHCFDGFTWTAGDGRVVDLPLKPGASFQSDFETNVSRFGRLITTHPTRIADISWSGEPVELLFLDAPKKHRDVARCLEVFGPALIPGKSVIAIQDYLYFPAYALAACMHVLRDRLELTHVVSKGSTVAFQVTGPIDLVRDRPAGWDIRRWPTAQVEESWDQILAALPAAARERLEAGRALHLFDSGAKAEAIRAMQKLPMTKVQRQKIARLSKSHHYLSYPELFAAAGYPGTSKQNLMSYAKRGRDWIRDLYAPN